MTVNTNAQIALEPQRYWLSAPNIAAAHSAAQLLAGHLHEASSDVRFTAQKFLCGYISTSLSVGKQVAHCRCSFT